MLCICYANVMHMLCICDVHDVYDVCHVYLDYILHYIQYVYSTCTYVYYIHIDMIDIYIYIWYDIWICIIIIKYIYIIIYIYNYIDIICKYVHIIINPLNHLPLALTRHWRSCLERRRQELRFCDLGEEQPQICHQGCQFWAKRSWKPQVLDGSFAMLGSSSFKHFQPCICLAGNYIINEFWHVPKASKSWEFASCCFHEPTSSMGFRFPRGTHHHDHCDLSIHWKESPYCLMTPKARSRIWEPSHQTL